MSTKKIFAIIGIIGLLGMTLLGTINLLLSRSHPIDFKDTENDQEKIEPEGISEENNNQSISLETEALEKQKEVLTLPEKVQYSVPFYGQSPFALWDDLHNEACEEASLLMAKSWLDNNQLNLEELDQKIIDAVTWQEKVWGGHFDLSVQRSVELAHKYFDLEKIYYTSLESIQGVKKELAEGNLVILPTAGRLLNNPYYTSPGPAYHMLIVTGYNSKGIVTNDPGTRRGESFLYSEDILWSSIHDWPLALGEGHVDLSKDEKAKVVEEQGAKIMIVVKK
ncbi:C39 family peptidase [Patescibacteria group bacterium]|nr:C39 family peptidase [Patescibacteria group bacterium]